MRDALDPAALAGLLAATGDDPEVVGELVDSFLSDAPRQLDAMRRAIDAGSAEDLMRWADSLMGSAQSMGATELAALSFEVEELARLGALDEAATRMAAMDAAWKDTAGALEAARDAGWDAE